MNTENLSTLKIHKLTQAQYDREVANGTLEANAIYLTPDEEIDLSGYATIEQMNDKADVEHNHDDMYYTESEVDAKLDNIQKSVVEMKYGITTVGKSESATKAAQDSNGNVIADTYETKNDATTKLNTAKQYTDNTLKSYDSTLWQDLSNSFVSHNISTDAHGDIRFLIEDLQNRVNTLANSDDATLDQINELVRYIEDNEDIISTMTNKVNVSDIIDNLETNVSDKPLSAAQGVVLSGLIDETYDILGDIIGSHLADDDKHFTVDEKTAWNQHVTSAHAPSNAQPNQNAFSNIMVGSTVVAADTTTDTVTFVGSNVTITPDATQDTITFTVADGNTSTKGVVKLNDSVSSSSTTTAATANSVKTAYNLADTANQVAEQAKTTADSKMNANNPTGTGSFSMNRQYGSDIGNFSHAEGYQTIASGIASHAEGGRFNENGDELDAFTLTIVNPNIEITSSTASGVDSHAEGTQTYASGYSSHAEGLWTAAIGHASHTEGIMTISAGVNSHAEGFGTKVLGDVSHAEGYHTTAGAYQHVQGHYNNILINDGVSSGTSDGAAFVIGNGTASATSNAFRVTYEGKVYGSGNFYSSGADYAEFFEWQDLNPNNEDRRGYFVTLDGEHIKIAEPNDYILGIVSGMPAVIGNSDECWQGRYILDDFGAFITEQFEYEEEVFDTETGAKKTITKIGTKYKENPDYDPTIPYVQRENRPEWDTVGMMGVLSVRDDGTCQVNGFCKVAEGGIATASESGYRVIKRVNENIIKVVFR